MSQSVAAALETLAPHFFQVAYVVPEIAAAEDWFRRTLGVPYFLRLPNVVLGETCTHRGQRANAEVHLGLGYMGDTQVELIESVRGPSIYSEFNDGGHGGLHHLGFAVPDFTETIETLRSTGMNPVADGFLETEMRIDFAYFDCTGAGASMIEILGFDAAARQFMEQLKLNKGDQS
jgi:methylmalonyl-CoA/ethylmalonyl-CoA epimerase